MDIGQVTPRKISLANRVLQTRQRLEGTYLEIQRSLLMLNSLVNSSDDATPAEVITAFGDYAGNLHTISDAFRATIGAINGTTPDDPLPPL